MKMILYGCVENSNRSQMAEAFTRMHAPAGSRRTTPARLEHRALGRGRGGAGRRVGGRGVRGRHGGRGAVLDRLGRGGS